MFLFSQNFNPRLPARDCETTMTVGLALSDVVIIAIKFVWGHNQ